MAATRVATSLIAGGLAGVVTGLVGSTVYAVTEWPLGVPTPSGGSVLVMRFTFMAVIAALTAAILGLLGGVLCHVRASR